MWALYDLLHQSSGHLKHLKNWRRFYSIWNNKAISAETIRKLFSAWHPVMKSKQILWFTPYKERRNTILLVELSAIHFWLLDGCHLFYFFSPKNWLNKKQHVGINLKSLQGLILKMFNGKGCHLCKKLNSLKLVQ